MLKLLITRLVPLCLALSACVAPDTHVDKAMIKTQIQADISSHIAAVNAKDYDKAAELYSLSSEFSWLEDGALQYGSRADIAEAFSQLSAATPSLEIENLSIDVIHARAAYVSYEFDQKLNFENGPFIEFDGVISAVMAKDGAHWQILHGHTSTPKPVAN